VFKDNITKDEVNELPLDWYKGKYTVITSTDQLDEAFSKINKQKFVGFDTETKPTFKKGQYHAVALIQIGIPDEVFLIRINQTGLADQIISFFENKEIEKIGVALTDDIKDLQKVKNFKAAGFVDLSKEVKQIGIESNGLRKLTAIMLGFRISKNAQVSNWEAPELSERQLIYAATDAWVCLEMYEKLLKVV
jgi:ribonuclease D